MSNRSKAMQAQKGTGRGCLWLFGGLFVLMGGAFFVFVTVLPLARLAGAMSWVETPCVIESSSLHTEYGEDGATYRPEIQYSYAFGDGDYYGDRYTFAEGTSSGRKRHQKVVDRYAPGSRAVCYVNPNAPEESVLSRKVTVDYLFGCFGLIFVAAGLLVIVLGTFAGTKSAAKSHQARAVGRMEYDDVGPTTLEPHAGPIAKFIGIVFVTVFWNGIVSVFLFVAAPEAGGGKWFVYLFMIPFVLVGIGLIVGVVYTFLAMFNPRVRINVSHGAPRLGTEVDVEWSVIGAAHRIRELRMWLEGREEATYTRGTDTYTDKHTFLEVEIVKTADRAEILSGRARFRVPEYTMHTWDGGNNKIVWELKVAGTIDRWPDVNEEYGYKIRPLALGGA